MRRKDREITGRGQIDAIIQACTVCHLGLALLMAQYSDGTFSFGDGMVRRTAVIRISLETLTGKQSTGA